MESIEEKNKRILARYPEKMYPVHGAFIKFKGSNEINLIYGKMEEVDQVYVFRVDGKVVALLNKEIVSKIEMYEI